MKGWRFYEEFKNKRKGISAGNVCAVDLDIAPQAISRNGMLEGLAGVYDYPNSPVCWTGISPDFLRKECKRVPEKRARAVHPELFKRLDPV